MASPSASSAAAAEIIRAAEAIADAKRIMITAGAGFGVDSGLPDFRGTEGFWRAYPPFAKLGFEFQEMSNPQWFRKDMRIAWGFFGHRAQLYYNTTPHAGFDIIRKWETELGKEIFVFTSNVDNHFHRSGFDPDRIHEVHGTLRLLQCLNEECATKHGPFPAEDKAASVKVDMDTIQADLETVPKCPICGGTARPNVMMFGDWEYNDAVSSDQATRCHKWVKRTDPATDLPVVMEFGAGLGVPTVRHFGERLATGAGFQLIRVNPREPEIPGSVPPAGALTTLRSVDELVRQRLATKKKVASAQRNGDDDAQ